MGPLIKNKLQLNRIQNINILYQGNVIKYVVCNMVVFLFQH